MNLKVVRSYEMKGLFLIVEEHEGWASYRRLDPVPPLSSKEKASTECTVKVSTKLFVFQGVILKLNHALKMHVLLYSAPSEELLVFPSLRTLTLLSLSDGSWVVYTTGATFWGHACCGAGEIWEVGFWSFCFIFLPKVKMLLIAIEPGPAKEMSNSRSSYVSLYHF